MSRLVEPISAISRRDTGIKEEREISSKFSYMLHKKIKELNKDDIVDSRDISMCGIPDMGNQNNVRR